ncbi:guanylate-binding protein [Ochromonadaceae sp. CCMP2298]|nr:guanylate-binding protein [Ochromonadaceae sp. CCMP2298]|mmetsp:Transcript_14650/g.32038  ORF Transcript_14650/g.32038 Transcript_14650/m.32038 type:complete len:675 (-) Transcript_14650:207-2231(-)|eukprot:CAMPEP_0173191478 /NCGR_PEP_ID=MMETSP1141-20130122/12903_1 /TAXON_ID=483371 /ORGANISM="non described non described, Strain CCMP2298" /LENGTH=674 /DNA_ID=CAMNT_0014115663 /DNA_START=66 /DNA_END=2090 /DNA_ORIENTATION=-
MASATLIVTYKDSDRGHWAVTEAGVAMMNSITSEVYVIGIAGAMRTGKSYMMNLLADISLPEKQLRLFDLGGTTESKTRGVWAYARPAYKDPSKSLLILDFEGMFDTSGERVNPNFDAQIFLLAVLLSSYFLYNTQSTIDADKLNKLGFVAEVGSHLNTADEDGHSSFFPQDFAWLVRDFMLDLEGDSEDSYLERALVNKSGNGQIVTQANGIKNAIKDNFKSRHCMTLPRPLEDGQLLQKVDEQPFSSLYGAFRSKVREVVNTIVDTVKLKEIKDGAGVSRTRVKTTGRELLVYTETLLTQLNTSAVFCVEDAWASVARKVTSDAFDVALGAFSAGLATMFKDTPPPTEAQAFQDVVDRLTKDALALYTVTAIQRDDSLLGAEALKTAFDEFEQTYATQNQLASEKLVQGVVDGWVGELLLKLENKSPELNTHGAYEQHKMTLLQEGRKQQGKVGTAWSTMETLLLGRLKEVDRVAALNFKLSAQEVEIAEQAAASNEMRAAQNKLENDLRTTMEEQKQREERWQQVQAELQKEHEKEMEEQRNAMSQRMDAIASEHAAAIQRGDLALAEQKEDAQRKLTEAIAGMETKHTASMQTMEANHQRSVHMMEQSQQALKGEIQKVREESEAAAARHKEELDKKSNESGGGGGQQVMYWHPQYGWIMHTGRGWVRVR